MRTVIPPNAIKASSSGSSGSVILEFALVVPFIFLLFVGTVEFSRALRVHEMMSFLAREAAGQAFRQCGADEGSRACTTNYSGADACLTRVHLEMFGLAKTVLGGAESYRLTLSSYRYDKDTDSILPMGFNLDSAGNAGVTFFSTERIRQEYFDLIKAHRVLTISEIFYDFTPVFHEDWMPASTFYDVSIY